MTDAANGNWTPDRPIVSLKDVHKSFGDLEVLKGISFDVMKGEVICIIGPSGSGKSTLIRCVNALNPIDSGSIAVEGQEVNDPKLNKLELRKKVGMVFQQYNLFQNMDVLRNVTIAPRKIKKIPRQVVMENAEKVLAKVGLADKLNAYPDELSGGQQQRVAIARALCLNPEILLLDEVTSALDPELVKEVLDTIRDLVAEGMTMLIVTHEMAFVREVASRVIFMDDGLVVEAGGPKDIFDNPQQKRTGEFVSKILRH